MIIPLPKDESIPTQSVRSDDFDYEWIGEYWRVPDWTCPECKAVMFGRMSYCVYCKMRLGKHTQKPA